MKRDKILLICENQTLRQLYHELLTQTHIEVTMAETITEALLMLTLHIFTVIIIYADDEIEAKTFLRLRRRRRHWMRIPLLVLTPEPDLFAKSLTKKDILFNSLMIDPSDAIDVVKTIMS